MEKIIGIYKITSPTKKVYIGQSINIIHRFNDYKNLLCKRQHKILNSLKKYGYENHKFEILHTCTIDELNDLEVYYINLYQSFNTKFGMNLVSGGKQNLVYSTEYRKRQSEKMKGKNTWTKGSKMPLESIQNRINTMKLNNTLNHSEKTKNKIRKARIDKGKKVIDIITGIIYPTIKKAASSINIGADYLGAQLSNRRKNNTNFKFYN